MDFKIITKDYQREYYEAPFEWNGIPLRALVHMSYHTFLHYWDVSYKIGYGISYVTPSIRNESNIVGKHGRTMARKFAERYMKLASPSDVEKLDQFYKGNILSLRC